MKGQSSWAPLYLVIVAIIAAILVITIIKPIMRHAAAAATETTQEAQAYAGAAIFIGGLAFHKLQYRQLKKHAK